MNEYVIPCLASGSKETTGKVKIIPYSGYYVKFIPQVKLVCDGCGKYLKFLTQTSEIIEKINKETSKIKFDL